MTFDYLYIDDFSKIVEMFIKKEPQRRSYNICTGQGIDLLTLAKMIQRVDGRNFPIDVKEEGLGTEYTGDNTLFLQEFGKFDFTPPEKAIGDLYRWYQSPDNIVLDTRDFK